MNAECQYLTNLIVNNAGLIAIALPYLGLPTTAHLISASTG